MLTIEIISTSRSGLFSRIAYIWNNEPKREILEICAFDPDMDGKIGLKTTCSICGRLITKGSICWREFRTISPCGDDLNPHHGKFYHNHCVQEISFGTRKDDIPPKKSVFVK